MKTELIIELPEFDTGQYEDCEFIMSGGDASLTVLLSELRAYDGTNSLLYRIAARR